MLSVSNVNNISFGANPRFVGQFSKEAKTALKNLPEIKNFDGDITFTLKKGYKNSISTDPTICKKLQMNATVGNKGKLIEVTAPTSTQGNLMTKNFIKEYKDSLGNILTSLKKWASIK